MGKWKTFAEAVAEVHGSSSGVLVQVLHVKGQIPVPAPPGDSRTYCAKLVGRTPKIMVLNAQSQWEEANLQPSRSAPESTDFDDEFQTRTTNIMFMDVAGWSALGAAQIFDYVRKVLPKLNEHLALGSFRNTWGDAIVATFDNAKDAAEAALKIRDLFRASYEHEGLPAGVSCRIALHQGDPMVLRNQITGARDIFGQGVHLAARLEPIVEPGHVFCTKKFADALNENAGAAPKTIPLGTLALAKGFGSADVALVLRPGEPDPRLDLKPAPTTMPAEPDPSLHKEWPIQQALRVELLPSDEAIAIVRKVYTDIRLAVRVTNLAPFPVKMQELHLRWELKASPDGLGVTFRCEGEDKVVKATREIDARSPYEFEVKLKSELPEVRPAPAIVRFGTGGHIVATAEPWGGNQEHIIGDFVWGYLVDTRSTA